MAEWIDACSTDDIGEEAVIRFDHGERTFAIYRSPNSEYFCTDGLCTHEYVHLADGEVTDYSVECPKHGSRYDYRTGAVETPPACIDLETYPTKVENGRVLIEI
jgi:3-phenylpropionate/trans-cinnamate dioxygenase ferredoxin subunit